MRRAEEGKPSERLGLDLKKGKGQLYASGSPHCSL